MSEQDERTRQAIEERRNRLGDRVKPNGASLQIRHLRAADKYDHPHLRPSTVEKGEWGYVLIQAVATFVASALVAAVLSFGMVGVSERMREIFAHTSAWSVWTALLTSTLLVTWFVIGKMHFRAKGWLLTGVFVLPVVAILVVATVVLA
jgi:hypothetical protein